MRLKHSISLFTLLLMANVTNTSNSEVIENIIVSAAKEEQNLEDVISAAVILNEKDILESGLRSVSEVLQMVGGIDISPVLLILIIYLFKDLLIEYWPRG